MDSIGAEVGQKMRSAIKAKLLELNCYVDDELPDYIMVMVANKRTKSQMKDDLQLFLTNKTATFVDWLHIVLKKLKEVTVTNPEIYKKAVNKRKSDDCTLPQNDSIKQEKKDKKLDKKPIKSEPDSTTINNNNNNEIDTFKSLTDDLPIDANQLAKQRKIVVMKVNQQSNNNNNNIDNNEKDNFDIPLLSEVNMSNEEELEMIEQKIKNVKTRLGLLVDNDDNDNNNNNSNNNDGDDDDEDYINLKAEPDELFGDELRNTNRTIQIIENINLNTNNKQKKPKTRITFNNDDELDENITKKKSVLERLGKRRSESNNENNNRKNKRTRISVVDNEKIKEGVLSRLGVMSKISIPQKSQQQQQRNEEEKQEEDVDESASMWRTRQVPSVVKIKPRIIPNDIPQPNKNLLLKAVADAQRSIAQAPKVGINATVKLDALFTKNYKEKSPRKLPETHKEKLKKILEPNNDKEIPQYIPTPIDKIQESDNIEIKQQFIVTLDGIEKTKFKDLIDDNKNDIDDNKDTIKPSIMSRLDKKKSPSPIVFDKKPSSILATTIKSNIPDRLPIVHPPPSIKNKERCKYWPQCRQGDKCEFVHPSINCELFPNCKFAGDKCLYLHPICKFGSSCTRRDCLYSHLIKTTICKYYPSCTNPTCQFYHPKPCKFGKNCKNQNCSFSHDFPITPTTIQNSLVWKSKY